jgi:hypothetical protein
MDQKKPPPNEGSDNCILHLGSMDFWAVVWYSEQNAFRQLDLFPSSDGKVGNS